MVSFKDVIHVTSHPSTSISRSTSAVFFIVLVDAAAAIAAASAAAAAAAVMVVVVAALHYGLETEQTQTASGAGNGWPPRGTADLRWPGRPRV